MIDRQNHCLSSVSKGYQSNVSINTLTWCVKISLHVSMKQVLSGQEDITLLRFRSDMMYCQRTWSYQTQIIVCAQCALKIFPEIVWASKRSPHSNRHLVYCMMRNTDTRSHIQAHTDHDFPPYIQGGDRKTFLFHVFFFYFIFVLIFFDLVTA